MAVHMIGKCAKITLSIVLLLYTLLLITSVILTIILETKTSQNKNKMPVVPYSDDDKAAYREMVDNFLEKSFNHTRHFRSGINLVDHQIMNLSKEACNDFYEYSCGNFATFHDESNEVMQIVIDENEGFVVLIDILLISHSYFLCVLEGNGCHAALEYYRYCQYDNIMGNGPNHLIQKLTSQMENQPTLYMKIRFLIKNGITNFVHLTKERIENGTWVHYLRPGGVLFPKSTIHIGLYGPQGLRSSMKKTITIGEFLETVDRRWRVIFGPNAKNEDLLIIENMQYFVNLQKLIKTIGNEEASNRLKWFIKHGLKFFTDLDCRDQTKLLFPITFCRTFLKLAILDDKRNGKDIGDNIYNHIKRSKFLTSDLRIGGCSSLLHSDDLGEYLIQIENNASYKSLAGMRSIEWAHEFLFKSWYKFYDPVYLYYTYPRILDEMDKKNPIKTPIINPLAWYMQVNAIYDPFHNEIVIFPGLTRTPIYSPHYKKVGKYSRLGYIVGHEIAHFYQLAKISEMDCIRKISYERNKNRFEKKKYEVYADIFGLSESFEYFYLNENPTDTQVCDFFLAFAQTFCSVNPNKSFGEHENQRNRLMLSLKYATKLVLDEFNKCFGCKMYERCTKLKE